MWLQRAELVDIYVVNNWYYQISVVRTVTTLAGFESSWVVIDDAVNSLLDGWENC
jgi:hypothetical protein